MRALSTCTWEFLKLQVYIYFFYSNLVHANSPFKIMQRHMSGIVRWTSDEEVQCKLKA